MVCYLTMQYHELDFYGMQRKLPIVSLGPKLKIASFNLLGDRELVNRAATELVKRIQDLKFDYMVGPEVKVVPLLHQMANLLGHAHYVICRKSIKGYMLGPVSSGKKPDLVLDGRDAARLKGKCVLIVDDVVSTGRTTRVIRELMGDVGAEVTGIAAIFKQGEDYTTEDLIYLHQLPLFR